MVYEYQLCGAVDWGSIIGAVGTTASNMYKSYTDLEALKLQTKDIEQQRIYDTRMKEIESQAIALMAQQGKSSTDTTMKQIMPIAIAGGAGLVALLAMK